MRVRISKGIPSGSSAFPPSKSFAHRYLIGGMLAGGSTIHHLEYSEDVLATLDCLSALGASINLEGGSAKFSSRIPIENHPILPCRESGSTLRFFLPIAAALCPSFSLTGTARLLQRGVGPYQSCLSSHGVTIESHGKEIVVTGRLTPGHYEIDGSTSSQYITGLLFALPLLPGDSEIHILGAQASKDYTNITRKVLADFGIRIEETPYGYFIPGNQEYQSGSFTVEDDASNAAFLSAFAALGAPLSLPSISEDSLQGDRVFAKHFKTLHDGFAEINVDNCIDLAPVLFAFASLSHGARFTGIERLSLKESSRAEAMKEELAKAGIQVELTPHFAVVHPYNGIQQSFYFDSHNDHRIAMALSLFSLRGNVEISGAEAVKKSYPRYFDELSNLGMEVTKYE